ncbi:hypothetical protein GGS23DRAFT_31529 [Durotheca rogersii]|uniref:uncharacterized protein n=1 Tax=Durotheca rogersii TaxID=419775 RepID=UPI0022200761|nr:uncharacterized protein GGS23DRAFT_31529 [Durotheca rogersii]KAI5868454.1 hypothetical protein GGS23DRAFT_31529 [Durotheca rogersii]
MCTPDLFLGFLAILFPPLPVWVKRGLCSADSIINILLCVLGYIPGLLHSWYIIAKYTDPADYEPLSRDRESGSITYVYVHQPSPQPQPDHRPQPKPTSQPNYGATTTFAASSNTGNAASSSSTGPANGEGSHDGSGRPPPTYAEAVKGDNKIQTHD